MASIKERNGAYRVTVSVGRDTKGKQILETVTFHPTAKTPKAIEKEVAAFAADFEKKVKDGKYLTGEKETFQEITERWLSESASENLSDGGEQNFDIIKRYAYPAFGTMKIAKITTLHIQDMINGMKKRGLSPKTIDRAIAAINSVFRYAYRLRIINENPCTRDRIELPKQKSDGKLHYFTPDQAQRFLDFLSVPYEKTIKAHDQMDDTGKPYHVPEYKQTLSVPLQHQVFFMLAIYGGFRRGELGALTWRDIDYTERTVTISKAVARRKGGQVVKGPKTEHGNRTVPLPERCFFQLQRLQNEQLKYRLSLGSAWQGPLDMDDCTIFINADGGMMDVSTVRKRFLSIIRRYNEMCSDPSDRLPEIRVHDLRHTFATIALANGVNIANISVLLGHEKISTTYDIYSHPLPENDRKVADILDRILSKQA